MKFEKREKLYEVKERYVFFIVDILNPTYNLNLAVV